MILEDSLLFDDARADACAPRRAAILEITSGPMVHGVLAARSQDASAARTLKFPVVGIFVSA